MRKQEQTQLPYFSPEKYIIKENNIFVLSVDLYFKYENDIRANK